MRRFLEIAAEARKTIIAVTYGLTIAKIQHKETQKYDGVFIATGSFHIEMTFFISG